MTDAIIETAAEPDKLAVFRQVARQEQEEKSARSKMSEKAKENLRSVNEHDRTNANADEKLVEWFNVQTWTVDSLMDLMYQLRQDSTDIRKRAIKAMHHLASSKVYHIHDVLFFGELTFDEKKMSLVKILDRFDPPDSVLPKTDAPTVASVKRCALGQKCIRAAKRKGYPVKGRATYCSPSCRARAKWQEAKQHASGVPIAA